MTMSIFDVSGTADRLISSNDKKLAAITGLPDGTY